MKCIRRILPFSSYSCNRKAKKFIPVIPFHLNFYDIFLKCTFIENYQYYLVIFNNSLSLLRIHLSFSAKSVKMEQEEEEAERERNSVDSRLIASLKKIVPSEGKMTSQKRRRTTRRFYSFPRKPERRRLSDESKHTWQGALNRGSAQMCFYQQVPILRRRNRQADRSVLFPSTLLHLCAFRRHRRKLKNVIRPVRVER